MIAIHVVPADVKKNPKAWLAKISDFKEMGVKYIHVFLRDC